ncbi:MAG: hypothetical protein A2252_08870 [Elusimicrobia bacterium RIFOXYA2_FULL_39_19]|nr:MAG: hypothetical protein A2252_08870 [Elusimicrobia bacterium RIFOXYA2_FULL_39_19]
MKKSHNFIGLAVGFLSVLIIFIIWWFGLLHTFENKFYDFKFRLRGDKQASKKVVIVGLDEDSLQRFGRWPWPRSIMARGIRNLKKAGVKVIGTDIIFPEPSRDTAQDLAFASALRYAKCVVGATNFEIQYEKIAEVVNDQLEYRDVEKRILLDPIPMFKKSFVRMGYTNAYPGEDGILRTATLSEIYEEELFFSFNATVAAVYLGIKPEELTVPRTIWVNYPGPEKSYAYYSFALIYDDTFPKDWIKDKAVLIGSTSTGTFDHYPTPLSNMYPGVEFHAAVIDNIIAKNYIHAVPYFAVLLIMLFLTFFISIFTMHVKTTSSVIVFFSVLIGYFFLSLILFAKFDIHLDFLKPGLGMFLGYIGSMGYRFRTEEREKKWIKKTFSSYMSPQVIKELAENPDKLKLGGEKKTMTVFFSDIRGFTSISEKYPPEEVVSILNEYLSAMTEIVFKYEGTLDKFVGDEIMAFWNSPLQQEDHAMRALNCSFDMMDRLDQLQEKWKQEGKPIIDIGIGLNTGEMIVGNMGSHQRMDYTVIGDNVNLGARIETLTRQYDSKIIISEYTMTHVKDKIEAVHLGEVKVKGKNKPVNVYGASRKKT